MKIFFLFSSLALILIGCSLEAQTISGETVFLEKIRSKNQYEIEDMFNELKTSRDKHLEIMELIFFRPGDYVEPKSIDLAKIHSADILAQSYRNRHYENHSLMLDILSFSKKMVLRENHSLSRTAISIIGYYDTPENFQFLLNVISMDDRKSLMKSVMSVVTMCSSYDEDKLDKVVNGLSSKKRREEIEDVKTQYGEKFRYSSWCELRQMPQ